MPIISSKPTHEDEAAGGFDWIEVEEGASVGGQPGKFVSSSETT